MTQRRHFGRTRRRANHDSSGRTTRSLAREILVLALSALAGFVSMINDRIALGLGMMLAVLTLLEIRRD